MPDAFTITIKSRGEELAYSDDDGAFHFDVSYEPPMATVHADTYWDGFQPYTPRSLTQAQRDRIFPRIVAYFTQRGGQVQIADSTSRDPLPSHYRR